MPFFDLNAADLPTYRSSVAPPADFAEFWVVMKGQLRWTMEGVAEPLIAAEGDIVYAPPKTFHIPQFYGKEGVNCRLTSSTFPAANHIFDAH